MKNNKGQALMEFIMILPVLLIIIMAIFDYANILFKKNEMNDIIDDIVLLYQNDKQDKINEFANKKGVQFSFSEDSTFVEIKIEKSIEINAPILSNILGNPYKLIESRTILKNEE